MSSQTGWVQQMLAIFLCGFTMTNCLTEFPIYMIGKMHKALPCMQSQI